MTAILALIAGAGMFLFVDALFPRRVRIRLSAPDERPLGQRLMDAFFLPAAERVAGLGRAGLAHQKAALAVRRKRAG